MRSCCQGSKSDSESFNGYMRALKLPKETEEETKIRTAALQQGLKEATEAPLGDYGTAQKDFSDGGSGRKERQ